MKRGTYLAPPLTMPAATTLRGEGASTLIRLQPNAPSDLLNVVAGDCVIDNVCLDGNKDGNNGLLWDCVIVRGPAKGGNASRARILNCLIMNAPRYGVVLYGNPVDVIIANNTVMNTGAEGLEVQSAQNVTLVGNTVDGAGASGILVWTNTAEALPVTRDIAVVGNTVLNSSQVDSAAAGIRLDDGVESVTISGNTVRGGGHRAEGILINSLGPRHNNVTCVGNTVTGTPSFGIHIGGSNNVIVDGNVVAASGSVAVYADANIAGLTITDNEVSGTVTGQGISIGGAATDVIVAGNYIVGSAAEGVSSAGALNLSISNNTIRRAGASGVNVRPATGTSISGNVVADCAGFGILCSSGSNVRISDNTVQSSGNMGILLNVVQYFACVGNVLTSCAVHGIRCVPGSAYGTISGNQITNNTSSHALYVNGAVAVSVTGNSVFGAALSGIAVDAGATGIAVQGNAVSSCRRSGIYILDATDCTIVGNTCRNNGIVAGNAGIFLQSSFAMVARCSVTGNRCYDDQGSGQTQYYGLRTFGTMDKITLSGNDFSGNKAADTQIAPGVTNMVQYAPRLLASTTVGTTQVAVPHGLGYVPSIFQITMTSGGTIWRSAPSDATNVYLTADSSGRTADICVG